MVTLPIFDYIISHWSNNGNKLNTTHLNTRVEDSNQSNLFLQDSSIPDEKDTGCHQLYQTYSMLSNIGKATAKMQQRSLSFNHVQKKLL